MQEINHAGDGGLWAELVQNRGNFFEKFSLTVEVNSLGLLASPSPPYTEFL